MRMEERQKLSIDYTTVCSDLVRKQLQTETSNGNSSEVDLFSLYHYTNVIEPLLESSSTYDLSLISVTGFGTAPSLQLIV